MSGLGISPESCCGGTLQSLSYSEIKEAADVLEDKFNEDKPTSQSFTPDVEQALQTFQRVVTEFNNLNVQTKIVVEKVQALIKSRLNDLDYMSLLPTKIQEVLEDSNEPDAKNRPEDRLSESFVVLPGPSLPIKISGNRKFGVRLQNSLSSDSFELIGSTSPLENATLFEMFYTWACGSARKS